MSSSSSASEDEGSPLADAATSSAEAAALQRRRERRRLSMRRYRLRQRRQAEEVAAAIQSLTFERDQLHLQLRVNCGEVLGPMVFNYVQQSAVEFVEQRIASAAAAAAANPALPVRRAENAQQKRRTALAFEVSSLKLFLQGGGLALPQSLSAAVAPGSIPTAAAIAASTIPSAAGMPQLPIGVMPGMSSMGMPSIGVLGSTAAPTVAQPQHPPQSHPQPQPQPQPQHPPQPQPQPQPQPRPQTTQPVSTASSVPDASNPAFKFPSHMGMPMHLQMQMPGLAPLGLAGLAGFGTSPSFPSQPAGLVPVQPGTGFPAPGFYSSMLPPAAGASAHPSAAAGAGAAGSASNQVMDPIAPPPAASPATSASSIVSGVSLSSTPSPMVPSGVICPAPRYVDGRSAFVRPRMPMTGPPMTTFSQMRPSTMLGGVGTTAASSSVPVSTGSVSSSTGVPATATVSYPMSVWGPVFN